jgi:hypothetical protein
VLVDPRGRFSIPQRSEWHLDGLRALSPGPTLGGLAAGGCASDRSHTPLGLPFWFSARPRRGRWEDHISDHIGLLALRPFPVQLTLEARRLMRQSARLAAQTQRKEVPMRPSLELRGLTGRIAQAVGDGDMDFLERHISRQADVAFLGTDPNE